MHGLDEMEEGGSAKGQAPGAVSRDAKQSSVAVVESCRRLSQSYKVVMGGWEQ